MLKLTYIFHNYSRKIVSLLKELGFPYYICSKLYDIHYEFISNKLKKIFILAYKKMNLIKGNLMDVKQSPSQKNIWVFWWQGKKSMPLLVNRCISTIFQHSGNYKVILLTKYNVRKYAKLPGYIYDKVNNGIITLTEFSDILRFNLLRYYGGLWMDATIYCTSNLPKQCFGELYTDSGGYDKYHSNVSLGKWTEFFIGGSKNQSLFIFLDEFFRLYWKYNNYLIDYFLADFALNYAYENNIGGFKRCVNNINSTPEIFELGNLLNDKFDSSVYNFLVHKSYIFKLNYKKKIVHENSTFYDVLIKK